MSSLPSSKFEDYLHPLDEPFSKLSVNGIADLCADVHLQDSGLWRRLEIVDDDVIRRIEAKNAVNPLLEVITEWAHMDGSEIIVLQNHLRQIKRDDLVKRIDVLRRAEVLLNIKVYIQGRLDESLSCALTSKCPGLMPLSVHVRNVVHRQFGCFLTSRRLVFSLQSKSYHWTTRAKDLQGQAVGLVMSKLEESDRKSDPGQGLHIEVGSGRRVLSWFGDNSIFFEDEEHTEASATQESVVELRLERGRRTLPVEEVGGKSEDNLMQSEQARNAVCDYELMSLTTVPIKESEADDDVSALPCQ